MKILFAAGEAWPFIKTGGLADVAYSLPKALKKEGIDVRVILPKYTQIDEKYRNEMRHFGDKFIWIEHHNEYVGIDEYEIEGITYYFVDAERYFGYRDNIYGENDDCERFTFFCKAVVETFDITGFTPDIIHCNDWHTGLIPIYLKEREMYDIRTMFTIHNLRFQGLFGNDNLEKILEIPRWAYYHEDGLKYYDAISFLKGGVVYSDIVTTVSKTYAEEIKTPWMGEGLDGLFNKYDHKLFGVVNGIDYDVYKLPRKGKTRLKTELQEKMGLEEDPNIPLVAMITRLDRQKGIDMLMGVFERMLQSTNIQFLLLGSGEPYYEDFFRWMERKYPKRVCSYIGFNQPLSLEIYSAADMFLMPSIFEPCGLSQMIAMRYGTIPIVRETGGLVDTVTPYNEYTEEGDGFGFNNVNGEELLWCIRYAISIYSDNDKWHLIMKNARARDNQWDNSAKQYIELYNKIV